MFFFIRLLLFCCDYSNFKLGSKKRQQLRANEKLFHLSQFKLLITTNNALKNNFIRGNTLSYVQVWVFKHPRLRRGGIGTEVLDNRILRHIFPINLYLFLSPNSILWVRGTNIQLDSNRSLCGRYKKGGR